MQQPGTPFKIFGIVLLALFIHTGSHAQWIYSGGNVSHNHTYPAHYSLAVDTADTPYAAFADLGNSYVVTVKRLDGFAGWTNVGTPGFITGSALFYNQGTAIAINPIDNSPWLAISDGDYDNKISVMRFDGTNWVPAGPRGITYASACNVKMVFTPDGTAYIVYNDCYNGSALSARKYSAGSWLPAGAAGFATGNYFNVTASPDNTISVAFQDFDHANKISVKTFNGTNWLYTGTQGFSEGEIQNVNITSDAGGTLYTCYTDYSQNSRLFVKKLVNNTWTTPGDDPVSQYQAAYSDISVNRFGIPYVSYTDGTLPKVKKLVNGTWNVVGNSVAAGSSYHTSLYNDSLGNPAVLTSLQPSSTLPFFLKYKPCGDADYGLAATATADSAITQTGGTTTITVSASGGVGPYTGTGTFTVGAGYYTYTITDANGCSTVTDISVTEPQPVCTDNYWTGAAGTDWNDVNNWSCGSVPGDITTVYIETGAANYPLVNSTVVCRQLVVATGVTVTVAAGGHINIVGE